MIKIICNFRLFDRDHWEEFDMEEMPLLIYSAKRRLIQQLLSKGEAEPDENDTRFYEPMFIEISLDNGSRCTIYKYKRTTWRNAKGKLIPRYFKDEPYYQQRTIQTI